MKRITELMHHLAAMMHYLHSHHLKPKYRNRLLFIAVFITVCLIAVFTGQHAKESASTASSYASVTKLAKTNHTPSYTAAEITRVTPKNIDWKAPS